MRLCVCVCVRERLPEHVVEGDVPPVVQPLHLVAHVLEEQLVLVQVHLQAAPQQTQQELHPGGGDQALGGRGRSGGAGVGRKGPVHGAPVWRFWVLK